MQVQQGFKKGRGVQRGDRAGRVSQQPDKGRNPSRTEEAVQKGLGVEKCTEPAYCKGRGVAAKNYFRAAVKEFGYAPARNTRVEFQTQRPTCVKTLPEGQEEENRRNSRS